MGWHSCPTVFGLKLLLMKIISFVKNWKSLLLNLTGTVSLACNMSILAYVFFWLISENSTIYILARANVLTNLFICHTVFRIISTREIHEVIFSASILCPLITVGCFMMILSHELVHNFHYLNWVWFIDAAFFLYTYCKFRFRPQSK